MKKILGLVLMVVTLISGCGTTTGAAKSVDLSNLTATQVVETYYNSIATGDYSMAKDCLSNEIGQQYVNSSDSDFKNIKSLIDLKVSLFCDTSFLKAELPVIHIPVRLNPVV